MNLRDVSELASWAHEILATCFINNHVLDIISTGSELLIWTLLDFTLAKFFDMVRLAVAFLTVSTGVLAPQGALALWPNPTSMTTGSQYLKLSKSISIEFDGRAPSDLQQAIERTKAQLKNDNMERLIVGRGGADAPKLGGAKELKKLTLSLTGSSASDKSRTPTSIFENTIVKAEEREESYSLTIPADGTTATLTANNTLGLFRGLTTFSQLFYTAGPTVYTYNAPIAIKDKAAFPHRGLLLDTARNYYPKADVLRTIDAMSWTKLNVLHWHIVDSQSFPLEVARYPELAKTGAYDPSSIYKISDIKEIVKYAGERGVDILLEIDTPGHTAVVSKSHPEFIACNEKVPWTKYANEPPAGQLRLASKDVITFTSQLFASVLENLPGKYFSTGGDEINANCYTEDPETQAQLKANGQTLDQALDVFTKETHAVVTKAGKSPVVWEEMVLNHNVTLSPDTVVMVWVSSGNAAAVAKKGFKLVQTPSDYFYLDCGGGGWVGANPNGNSWCDPYKTWQKIYSFDPYLNLPDSQKSLVLGGQSLLWSEQSDPNTLDEKLWPRAAAAAEVFWTGANGPDGKPRNGTEAFQRIHDLRYRFVQRGIKAVALQPLWCALRPGACDLVF